MYQKKLGHYLSGIQSEQRLGSRQKLNSHTESQFGLINAVGSAGVVIAALLVGRILKRWSSTRMLLPLLALQGSAIVGMSFTSSLWLALPFWAVFLGSEQCFAICTFSLRQTIVPNQMLARVQTSNVVVGLSGVPLGSLAGGAIIHATGNVMGGLSWGRCSDHLALHHFFLYSPGAPGPLSVQEGKTAPVRGKQCYGRLAPLA